MAYTSDISERQGTLLSTMIEAGREKVDVADTIFLLQPDDTPLIALQKLLSRRKEAIQPVYSWFFDDLTVVSVTVLGAQAANDPTIEVVAGQAVRVLPGSVLMNTRTGEHVYVTAVNTSTDVLTVIRGFGTTAAAAMNDADTLLIIGPSIKEAEDLENLEYLSTIKEKKSNYVQIFAKVQKFSFIREGQETFGGPDRDYEWKKLAIEFNRSVEWAFLFGEPKEYISGTDIIRTTGGLNYFLSTDAPVLDMNNAALTKSAMDSFLADVYRYDPIGVNNERWLLCSSRIAREISQWADSAIRVTPGNQEKYGFHVQVYYPATGGVLYVKEHRLLTESFPDRAFVVAPQDLSHRFLKNNDTVFVRDAQKRSQTYHLDFIYGVLGFELHFPPMHGKIINVA